MFYGSLVALITPFRAGVLDEDALVKLVEWHIQQGTQGIVACGSTGESLLLTPPEQHRILDIVVQTAAGRIPVIAGAGAVSTQETILLATQAKQAGVQGLLIVTPPYLKPPAEALYRYYEAVHNAVDLPIIVYNNPGRTGINLDLKTLTRIAQLPNVVGFKDSGPSLAFPTQVRQALGPDFLLLSGEDATTVAFLAQGGHGSISVTANVAPTLCAQLHAAWQVGDLSKVAVLRDQLHPLHEVLFLESNPIPCKYAVSLLGLCQNEVRSPLLPLNSSLRSIVQNAMVQAGLLSSEAEAA